ncbi:NADP-dependent oxidoreductase [Streptomyces rishiriensis]|uniref:NADP-dependent oxidoreductase n=1 Tax=Streptomyces rishiriensis TaxID=68264 RepID=UPI000D595059|nr:NADP-dependent oxidoreductase [Streptomyces rishiriensis]
MKAISYSRYGGPETLVYGDVREPKVGPDSVLVKVRAAAVNPVDWKCREGHLDPMLDAVFPVVPGWDVSGVVVQLGVSVAEYAVGDEVIGYVREDFLSRGTFAEYVAAPVRTLARKPRHLTWEEAAGLPLTGLTAYQVLTGALQVKRGETVLVHAAAGGVGSMAVQLARHLGARVIGTASEANHDFVRSLGGEPVAHGAGLAERVRGLAPEGVDAAFDTVGGESLKVSANLLAPEGRLVSIADGEVIGYGGRYYWVRPDAEDLTRVAELAEQGVLRVHVSRTFPLERAAEAHRLNEEGRTRGKIVVTVAWDPTDGAETATGEETATGGDGASADAGPW